MEYIFYTDGEEHDAHDIDPENYKPGEAFAYRID